MDDWCVINTGRPQLHQKGHTSFCGCVTISHLFIYIYKMFHHFDVCTYVLYVFYYLFATSKRSGTIIFPFHFITAVHVLHVSE